MREVDDVAAANLEMPAIIHAGAARQMRSEL
jgi:hypothetical protein